jgi:dihydropyrimidine dehydrogenase (NAD+) subunit PreT
VIGGGDSAIETALALADQPGNQVTLAYRQDAFFRLRSKNRDKLQQAQASGRVEVLLQAQVQAIGSDHVELAQEQDGGSVALQLAATDVFVMAGGVPPFAQLERSGVSFDPTRQPAPTEAPAPEPASNGLLLAVGAALLLAALTLGFVLWHADYYLSARIVRAADPKHALLRPDRALGLAFGFAAVAAIVANLLYLVRRQQWFGLRFGQLTTWMHAHVATGVLALLAAMLHAAMAPKTTVGGFAFWALALLLVTGAIGRWFYAWLPRRANGRELELAALRSKLAATHADDDAFTAAARAEALALLERRQWRSSWFGKVAGLVGLSWDLARTERRLRRAAVANGAAPGDVRVAIAAAREAHAAALAVAHLEDLRALLGSWRWLHRWVALLMVLLLVVHVVVAVLHGAFAGGGR